MPLNDTQLDNAVNTVKDEVNAGANTANRVGTLFGDVVEYFRAKTALLPTVASLAQMITDFNTAIAGKADASHEHDASEITTGAFDEAQIPTLPQNKVDGLGSDLGNLQNQIDGKQEQLVAGANIAIVGNVISSTGGGGSFLPLAGGTMDNDVIVDFPETGGKQVTIGAGYVRAEDGYDYEMSLSGNEISNKQLSTNRKISINFETATVDRTILVPNKSGTILLSTDTEIFTTVEKSKLGALTERWRGLFTSFSALTTAIPIANAGDTAQVDAGAGSNVVGYMYDVQAGWVPAGGTGNVTGVNGQTGAVVLTTDEIGEGGANKYSTRSLVMSYVLTGISFATATAIVAGDNILQAFGKIQAQINAKQATLLANDITSSLINANAVTTAKIANNAVDNSKLAQAPAYTVKANMTNAIANVQDVVVEDMFVAVPSSSSSPGNYGQMAVDGSFFYICNGSGGVNNWRKVATITV